MYSAPRMYLYTCEKVAESGTLQRDFQLPVHHRNQECRVLNCHFISSPSGRNESAPLILSEVLRSSCGAGRNALWIE